MVNNGPARGKRSSKDKRATGGRPSKGSGPRSHGRGRPKKKDPVTPRAERSGWGSVAQHGAAGATHGQRLDESERADSFSPEERAKFEQREAKRKVRSDRTAALREEASAAVQRSGLNDPQEAEPIRTTVERQPIGNRKPVEFDVRAELIRRLEQPAADRKWKLYKRAGREFEQERFNDARVTLKPLREQITGIPDIHELYGLALYRLGHWHDAVEELETFRDVGSTVEQHPVLMDCHRALGNWADVDELWDELGSTSPRPDLVVEGRIVVASSYADRGNLDKALRVLEKGWKAPKNPELHHLRRAYALADLMDRSGAVPRSRKLFAWIAQHEPNFGDAAERAESLA